MSKKLLIVSILMSVLIMLFSTYSEVANAQVYWLNQCQNDTYVDFGAAVKLCAQGEGTLTEKDKDFSNLTDKWSYYTNNQNYGSIYSYPYPPSNLSTELSSAQYTNISAYDGSLTSISNTANGNDVVWDFVFTVSEDITEIYSMNFTLINFTSDVNQYVYVWNVTRGNWSVVSSFNAPEVMNKTFSLNPTDVVNTTSNKVWLRLFNDAYYLGSDISITVEIDYVKLYVSTKDGVDFAILSTNETGTWENKTTYGSPKDMNDVLGPEWSNFTWQNTSLGCNKIIGWRIYYNSTKGNVNATPIKTFYYMPYINATQAIKNNIDSVTCPAKNNITITWGAGVSGLLEVWMPYKKVDSYDRCPYEMDHAYNITINNLTNFCYVKGYLKDITTGTEQNIYTTIKIRSVPPSNLPAALGVAAVSLIIVIYYITSTKEE